LRVDLREDVLMDERHRGNELDPVSRAFERPNIAVPPRMDEPLDRAAADIQVGENWRVDLIPVPCVRPVVLVMPLSLAGRRIERDHRAGVEIVARMRIAGPGCGVADAPVDQVERRIVIAGKPRRSAAGLPVFALPGLMPGLARTRNGISAPQFL